MSTRISTDLGDLRLMRLLKAEAAERETSVKDVLTRALEAYFAERLETRALARVVLLRMERPARCRVRQPVKPGDVVLVRFPFADPAAAKKRPALLLAQTPRSPRYRLATVAMITSHIEALELEGDVRLADWKAAGLLHPSLLRLAKIATIDAELIDKRVGRLSSSDIRAARTAFQRVFSAWLR
jgi:mRNA interferase MazF